MFQGTLCLFLTQRKTNKAILLLLRVQGLTSAAELFPGWGHPVLWCLSAPPTPWSWRCPEARHRDGCEERTMDQESTSKRKAQEWRWWEWWLEQEWSRDKTENVLRRGQRKRNRESVTAWGHEWWMGGKRRSLLISLTKQKTREGNANTFTAREGASVPDNVWMTRNVCGQENTEEYDTVVANVHSSTSHVTPSETEYPQIIFSRSLSKQKRFTTLSLSPFYFFTFMFDFKRRTV